MIAQQSVIGSITYKTGEKQIGYIKPGTRHELHRSVYFSDGFEKEYKKYSPKDIISFSLSDELFYISKKIKVRNASGKYIDKEVFLKYEIYSDYSLLSYYLGTTDTFFILDKNDSLFQLIYEELILTKSNENPYYQRARQKREIYKQTLINNFSHCESLSEKYVKKMDYTLKSLKAFVFKLNGCQTSGMKNTSVTTSEYTGFSNQMIGEITFNDGSVQAGYCRLPGKYGQHLWVNFSSAYDGKYQLFYPEDLVSYKVDNGGEYISRVVKIDNDSGRYVDKRIFLKYEIKSDLSLLSRYYGTSNAYYILTKNDEVYPLLYDEVLLKKGPQNPNYQKAIYKREIYKQTLLNLFKDCPLTPENYIKNMNYDFGSLSDFVFRYNRCLQK